MKHILGGSSEFGSEWGQVLPATEQVFHCTLLVLAPYDWSSVVHLVGGYSTQTLTLSPGVGRKNVV